VRIYWAWATDALVFYGVFKYYPPKNEIIRKFPVSLKSLLSSKQIQTQGILPQKIEIIRKFFEKMRP
jgi:hypothetical protein